MQIQDSTFLIGGGEYAALVCHMVENEVLNGEVIWLNGAIRMAPR